MHGWIGERLPDEAHVELSDAGMTATAYRPLVSITHRLEE
jgi:hypothetical protein